MMVQGPGIVDIEDMDQDMFEQWRELDMLGRSLLNLRPDAPPGVILLYTLNIDNFKGKGKFNYDNADNEG